MDDSQEWASHSNLDEFIENNAYLAQLLFLKSTYRRPLTYILVLFGYNQDHRIISLRECHNWICCRF